MTHAIVRCRGAFPLKQSAAAVTAAVPKPRREPTASLLHWLGTNTRQYHAMADRARLTVLDTTSVASYRSCLERIHGFESAVEAEISTVRGLDLALSGTRERLARLRQDLGELGLNDLETSALPRPRISVSDASEALGWLFVVERHVLLAGLVRRVLASERSAYSAATAYFSMPADGGTRLRDFGQFMATVVTLGNARADAIAAAARRAFDAQHHWYTRQSKRSTTQPLFLVGRRPVAL